VRDAAALAAAIAAGEPQVVFHLAAQPIVREPFASRGDFATNVMGTVNLLEACRRGPGPERIVVFTTDKVYRNDQSGRPFEEGDRLGGNEPYSASKAAAEWVAAAYWETYLRRAQPGTALADGVRAGNIVGGGDWARERLLPDAMRAFAAGRPLVLRSPGPRALGNTCSDAVRGTLLLAERMPAPDAAAALAWNLGPPAEEVHSVGEVADEAVRAWGEGASWRHEPDASIPESRALCAFGARAQRSSAGAAAGACATPWAAAWRGVPRSERPDAALLDFTRSQIEEHAADVLRAA